MTYDSMGKSVRMHLIEFKNAKYFGKDIIFYPTATNAAKGSPNTATRVTSW